MFHFQWCCTKIKVSSNTFEDSTELVLIRMDWMKYELTQLLIFGVKNEVPCCVSILHINGFFRIPFSNCARDDNPRKECKTVEMREFFRIRMSLRVNFRILLHRICRPSIFCATVKVESATRFKCTQKEFSIQ